MPDTDNLPTMDGSTSTKSYLMIARRGDIALGFKFLGLVLAAGDKVGFGARLRSSKYGVHGWEEHASTETNVVSLAESNLTLESAWPGIQFDQVSDVRASAVVSMQTRLEHQNNECVAIEGVLAGAAIDRFVDFAFDAAGEYKVLRAGLVRDRVRATLQKRLDHAKAIEQAKLEASALQDQNLDKPLFNAMLIKQAQSIQATLKKHEAAAEAADEDFTSED